MIKVRNKELIDALGVRVRSLRTAKKMTMEQLSELAGIDSRQLGYIERGKTNATISTLYVISNALGISIFELMDFSPFNKK